MTKADVVQIVGLWDNIKLFKPPWNVVVPGKGSATMNDENFIQQEVQLLLMRWRAGDEKKQLSQ
jgi:hypothetical protein